MSKPQIDFSLKPINLHDYSEYEEFREQRRICGWNHQTAVLDKWRGMIDARLKNLFWITLPDRRRIGHVSLDSHDGSDPPDLRMANPDGSLMTIATFWISPQSRSSGIGRAVMERLETMAVQPPYGSARCTAMALHTLSRKYLYGPEQEYQGFFERMGWKPPKQCNEDWYRRQGYIPFGEEPKYPEKLPDGTDYRLLATLLRKDLQ